jgi:glutamine synthetase adenylyltransferase
LAQLARHGFIPREEAEFLTNAYAFLRNVESRIRLLFETARDVFPEAPEKLEPLAIALGYAAKKAQDPRQRRGGLRAEFLRTTRRVRSLFERLIKS